MVDPNFVGPPAPSKLGQALGGVRSLWDQVGKDPAITRAAQVLALQLIGGTGDWRRDVAQAGLGELQTFEQVKERQKAEAEREATRKEEQRRYDEARERQESQHQETRQDKATALAMQVKNAGLDEKYRQARLELERAQLRASREAVGTANATADERQKARLREYLQKRYPNLDPLKLELRVDFLTNQGASRGDFTDKGLTDLAMKLTEQEVKLNSDQLGVGRNAEMISPQERFLANRRELQQLVGGTLTPEQALAQWDEAEKGQGIPPLLQAPSAISPSKAVAPVPQAAASSTAAPAPAPTAPALPPVTPQEKMQLRSTLGKKAEKNGLTFEVSGFAQDGVHMRVFKNGVRIGVDYVPWEKFKSQMEEFQ